MGEMACRGWVVGNVIKLRNPANPKKTQSRMEGLLFPSCFAVSNEKISTSNKQNEKSAWKQLLKTQKLCYSINEAKRCFVTSSQTM